MRAIHGLLAGNITGRSENGGFRAPGSTRVGPFHGAGCGFGVAEDLAPPTVGQRHTALSQRKAEPCTWPDTRVRAGPAAACASARAHPRLRRRWAPAAGMRGPARGGGARAAERMGGLWGGARARARSRRRRGGRAYCERSGFCARKGGGRADPLVMPPPLCGPISDKPHLRSRPAQPAWVTQKHQKADGRELFNVAARSLSALRALAPRYRTATTSTTHVFETCQLNLSPAPRMPEQVCSTSARFSTTCPQRFSSFRHCIDLPSNILLHRPLNQPHCAHRHASI